MFVVSSFQLRWNSRQVSVPVFAATRNKNIYAVQTSFSYMMNQNPLLYRIIHIFSVAGRLYSVIIPGCISLRCWLHCETILVSYSHPPDSGRPRAACSVPSAVPSLFWRPGRPEGVLSLPLVLCKEGGLAPESYYINPRLTD